MQKINGHGEKKSRKREMLICALLTESSVEAVARKTGIAPNTALRWLQDSAFKAEYQEARRQAVGQAIAQLQQTTSLAVTTLRGIMTDDTATPASRVSAARVVLETSVKAIEIEDLAARIERLEQALKEGGTFVKKAR